MSAAAATLFANPETARAIERTRAAVVLVGSYDGSGNYGDLAQLDAALDLVGRLGPRVVALPILERQHLAGHRRLNEAAGTGEPAALFFDPGGENEYEDDLLPVAAPDDLAFGASYLYGGGYLNSLWGARKLAMLDAAESLLAAGGAAPSCHLSTGLQVEPGWVEGLPVSALERLELRGARDSASREALSSEGRNSAMNTGDDAVGVLSRLPSPTGPADDGSFHLNLHFAEHGWVTERPGEALDFFAGFIAELGRLVGRPLAVQPLIAYLDERQDERQGVERLASACAARGIAVAEPLLLRPAGLAEMAPQLGAASLTLSCSYHVALTSLMLEVPAVLIGDNAYYEQKAVGLREDFALPDAFSGPVSADPAMRAGEIASILLDAQRGPALRGALAAAAERQRRRRATTEAELLGRLGGAAVAALDGRAGRLSARVGQLAAEPAELHTRLAALQTETERLQHLAEESPLGAELRVRDAEARASAAEDALTGVVRSYSWRLLAPLRRLKALLLRR